MGMRLRKIGANWVALCAAKTSSQAGDVYLNDAQDHALRTKLACDLRSEGYDVPSVNVSLETLMLNIEASEIKS